MKKLFILRGIMGSGKSTFIKNNGLELYTLSTDKIRLMYQAPMLNEQGSYILTNNNDDDVFKTLLNVMESKMNRGEIIFVDAVHATRGSIDKYKDLVKKYRYRAYVIDFSNITLEKALEQNLKREEYKIVPNEDIKKAYANILKNEIPSFVEVINHKVAMDYINIKPLDFSNYERIHHIGDIHGCYSVLRRYMIEAYFNEEVSDIENIVALYDENNKFLKAFKNLKDASIQVGISEEIIKNNHEENNILWKFGNEINVGNLLLEDELYIFTGDYIDRGIENEEVLRFLFRIMGKANVMFIEGNHECHLSKYANNEISYSPDFEKNTKLQLTNIDKKDLRKFYRKLIDMVYYKYNDKYFLVNHGGLSNFPDNLNFITSEQFIKGVGSYDTNIDFVFTENVKNKNIYQIHGHRNYSNQEFGKYPNSFSLENEIEYGGNLRVFVLDKNGFNLKLIKNNIYKLPAHLKMNENVENMIEVLKESEDIKEREFGNISSFNFTRDVFYSKRWNTISNKARGLFINTNSNKIVARGYEKFFNIGEIPETNLETLEKNLKFPMTGYLKENGYLGLVGYDEEKDDLLFCSKSTITGDFSNWLKKMFFEKVDKINEIKNELKTNNMTFTFEVIDIINDAHIIDYDKSKLVLLDAIYRTPVFKKLPYLELKEIAKKYGFECKEKLKVFNDFKEFKVFKDEIDKNDFLFKGKNIEGFVFEDNEGFMFKIKLPYYQKWKYIRGLKERGKNAIISSLKSVDYNVMDSDFLNWLVLLPEEEYCKSIIYLRNKYFSKK